MKTIVHKSSVKYYHFLHAVCTLLSEFKSKINNENIVVSAQLVNGIRGPYPYAISVLCLHDKRDHNKPCPPNDLLSCYETIYTFNLNWANYNGVEQFSHHAKEEFAVAHTKIEQYFKRTHEINSL